jgi:hypothetical protein
MTLKHGFPWQKTQVESASFVVHSHNIERWKSFPHNTTLESGESLILHPPQN